jgi:hypothetical protein
MVWFFVSIHENLSIADKYYKPLKVKGNLYLT